MKSLTHSLAFIMAATIVAAHLPPSAYAAGTECIQSATPPPPPDRGAVLWSPPDGSTGPNTVIIVEGQPVTDTNCAFTTINTPHVITVAPGVALQLTGADGKINPWGAVNVTQNDPIPDFTVNDPNGFFTVTKVEVIDAATLLGNSSTCRHCDLSNASVVLPLLFNPSSPYTSYAGDVTNAKLNGATLSGQGGSYHFDGSDLSGASLRGANLRGASFQQATVSGTHFDGAQMQEATFTALKFDNPPTFDGAAFGGFSCTTFVNTDLRRSSFTGVTWSDTFQCSRPSFPGSQIPLQLLVQLIVTSNVRVIDWTGAAVVATHADRHLLAGAALSGINLSGIAFLGEALDLTGTKLDGANLGKTNLSLARLAGALLTNITAPGASFTGADLSGTSTLSAANFSGQQTNLQGADFVNATLSGAKFVGADLSGAAFNGAMGPNSDFSGATATNAVFRGAHLYGNGQAFNSATDLSNIDFTNAVLASDPTQSGGFDFTGATL
ncbi:pentapeptide repeat-containing protein, partial [Methyloterricola oryzae]|uniref:pentapeptide repeat-containing protein n=1 Tax=Methyloterricola oryzae TaxID=1495050 RepID=UPI00190FDD12